MRRLAPCSFAARAIPAASDRPCPRLPVAKRISGDAFGRRMSCKERIVLMEPIEITVGQPTQTPQGNVKRASRMTF